MFKLYQTIPTSKDAIEVICDYMEYRCLTSKTKKTSINDLVREFLRPEDEKVTSGINDIEDEVRERLQMVISEIDRRIKATKSRYPFEIIDKGNVLKFKNFNSIHDYLYVYLLFATRLNMQTSKMFKSIDGTLLFEGISSLTAQTYFGLRAQSHVFGTSQGGGFKAKVETLCSLINEGNVFTNQSGGPVTENDGTLDFVSWIDFNDARPSKLIAFGQSKTGTDWHRHLTNLMPANFSSLWFNRVPAYIPIRLFFIADIPENSNWYKISSKSGILFDRLRILDYAPKKFSVEMTDSIKKWTLAAIGSVKTFKADRQPAKRKKRSNRKH